MAGRAIVGLEELYAHDSNTAAIFALQHYADRKAQLPQHYKEKDWLGIKTTNFNPPELWMVVFDPLALIASARNGEILDKPPEPK